MKAVMYHYVRIPDPELPFFKFLHFDEFKKQLDYFEEKYKILHPQQLKNAINNGEKPEGVVLTFDDGLKDHFTFILPELKRRGLSGIFYVSTGIYQTKKILGVHRLHLLLGKYGGEKVYNHLMQVIKDDMLSHIHVEEFRTLTYTDQQNDERSHLVKRIMNYFISYQYRETILDELMKDMFGDEEELVSQFYLNPSEIKQMYEEGMVIGSHTVNHPVLSKLSTEEQLSEIKNSFDYLEEVTGGLNYRTFCYPYGGFHSFTSESERILDNNNCLYAFNVENRDISFDDLNTRKQALPRYDCNLFPHGKAWQS
jgi:peptidoglycan/xylan/chitin deacetylase (PgdA/CDA1 family)